MSSSDHRRVLKYPMNYVEAMAWLDGHINMEKGSSLNDVVGVALSPRRLDPPSLSRMRTLLKYLGDPQVDVPFIHITGTNGKGSTARMAASLLAVSGRSVGTYTSPHLVSLNERISYNGVAISDEELAQTLSDVALAEDAGGESCSFFELTTAAAYRYFGDIAVEAAVIEVGMGGNWDATNAGDGGVAVITNVDLDHVEYFGPTRSDIATEKIGIVKPGSIAIIGERDPDLAAQLHRDALERGAVDSWQAGEHFGASGNKLAISGRVLDLRTPRATYTDVFIPFHGRHQADNAAVALAAVEAFLGEALSDECVREGFAAARHPGRLEIVGRRPLIVLDGAHNPAGAKVLKAALDEEFAVVEGKVVVMGLLNGRNEEAMVAELCVGARQVLAVAPDSPRAMDPARIVAACAALGVPAAVSKSVSDSLAWAKELTGDTDMILVTGSLYLIGEARTLLVRDSG
jgi:dihydrofolate synthase / folylpolyglutamate synthase